MPASYKLTHNPTTITAQVYGVVGPSGTAWKVVNRSTVDRGGIYLLSGGIVTNGAVGATRALIKGALKISGAAGTVKNFGSIADPVILSGGTVTNGGTSTPNASMSAGVAIESYGGPKLRGTVTNLGSISNGSYGVYLQAGGSVQNGLANFTRASIAGLTTAVDVGGGFATVTNFGVITGRSGVSLGGGGIVTNGATSSTAASISGGVQIVHGRGALSNFGAIAGAASLSDGGSVTNGGVGTPGASITGSAAGVAITGAAGTVTNFGRISGPTGYGATLAAGAVTNEAGASIAGGGEGVGIGSDGTVTNFGTISGSRGYGVIFSGGGLVANGGLGAASATISGGEGGVRMFEAGTVTNFGTISGHSEYGVLLPTGGTVTNQAGALIAGGTGGVGLSGGAASVTNFGSISGHKTVGIFFDDGGVITNGANAKISGGEAGVRVDSGDAATSIRVTNFGTISSPGPYGGVFISIFRGGSAEITNKAGALIAGGKHGVDLSAGTLTNFGRIEGSQDGAYLGYGGGLITNGGPGSIHATISGGATGVVIDANTGTVRNFGTIIGAAGTAVQFFGQERLVIEPGAEFLGASGKPGLVLGNSSTLELAAKSSGVLPLGTQFVGFSTVVVDSGASWEVDVGLTTLKDETITGNGTNVLAFTAAGTFDLSAVRGFPTISLTNIDPNALTLADANFSGVAGGVITVNGGGGDHTIVAALAAKHHVVLHGGAGADIFELSPTTLATAKVDGGGGGDTLAPSAAGKLSVGGVSGVETFVLADGGASSLSLTKSNFAGVTGATITVVGGQSGNTVDASSLTAANRVVFVGGQGTDVFTGGAGNDVFEFAGISLAATDTVKGGAGNDELVLTTAATVPGGRISGVETFVLASDFANLLTLTNASFVGVTGNKITVLGGTKGNTLTADLGAGHSLVLDGGAGDDLFTLSPAALAGATVAGRAGSDTLAVTGSGTLSAAGMSGVETIELPFTAANTLTLTNANFAGVTGGTITVFGGNGGDTITANLRSGLSVVLNGGSGTNRFNLSTAALAAAKVLGGQGADTLALTNPGTVAVTGVNGVETYRLADGGANSLTLTEANFGGLRQSAWITIEGGNAGNTINASTLESESPVILVGGLGKDIFTGGAGNDFFEFTAANLGAGDIVKGGTGSDELLMTTAGTVQAGGISGVETYVLADGGANSLTLTNASFAGVTTVSGAPGNTITVLGGDKGNTLTANVGTGLGVVFDGGAGNDRVTLSAATLAASIASIVSGGAGNDTLAVTGDGALSLLRVTGFETIELSGAATLSLADANFTDVTGAAITVDGGGKADTISAAGVSATNRVVMNAGAGGATLVAAQNAQMTGGAGADVFELTTPGNAFGTRNQITIANFAHGTDKIAFSEFGFALGSTSVAATLFTANPTGSFTAPTQQFAYNTATGALYARGASSSQLLIATLSGHPTLAAGDITFVA